MLTDMQSKMFKDIDDDKSRPKQIVSPKQKADFYFRMSKILKEQLEDISDAIYLLNKIPDSYLEKIDLADACTGAMNLSEKILEKMALPSIQNNHIRTEIKAVKSFDLGENNFRIPPHEGIECAFQPIGVSISCDLTKNENETIRRIINHIRMLKEALFSEREKVTRDHFNEIELQIYDKCKRKGVACRTDIDIVEDLSSLDLLLKTYANIEERERLDRLYPNLEQEKDKLMHETKK